MKDIIIAWLNGAEIVCRADRSSRKWYPIPNYSVGCSIYFSPQNTYRIKPKEPDYVEIYNKEWEACEPSGLITQIHARSSAVKAVVDAAKQWQKENG